MNIPEELKTQKLTSVDDGIDLKRIFAQILDRWKWLLAGVLIALFFSFIYIKYTAPVYQINSRLLVNDDEKGGLGKQAGSLMDLGGILGGKHSVDNEVEILKTRFLMEQVVRDMQLNIIYSQKSGYVTREVYESPFKVELLKTIDTIKVTSLKIKKLSTNKLRLSDNGEDREVNWNVPIDVKGLGIIKLSPVSGINFRDVDYFTTIEPIDERVSELMNSLAVSVSNAKVSVIDLGLKYPLPKKGEDILYVLIRKYIESNLSDKNAVADSTYKFIKQRLNVIATELGDVENKVEDFKQTNKLSDMSEQGKLLVQNTSQFASDLSKTETQVTILNDLENYLLDEKKNKRVFPSSLLPSDMVFSSLMDQYNSLLLERDRQLLSVTEQSPFIRNIDGQISEMRRGILANIQNTKNTYVVTRDKLRARLAESRGQISGVPEIEKKYLQLARNKDIKQELYIFLMQKAEETAISKTSNISVAKIIDPPKSQIGAISPRRGIVYMLGLVFGLIVPILVLLIVDVLDNKISSREDILAATSVTIVGEINHNEGNDNLIVANHGRSAISEQFRALRTNLSFYLKNKDEKVILLTSSMSGEGKSFTAINLGNILALAGRKVLLMELDLRKPGLSIKLGLSNEIGFSNFTIDSNVEVKDIIKPLTVNSNMYIISSGPLPPNPAETLMSDRAPDLFKKLKEEFDYILMDAPPIGIITDAQLLARYADVTLYLVRQGVTRKDQLKFVDDLYQSGKMKRLGIVVNDILSKQYGYGYGYGTYGVNEDKSGFFQSIKNKFKLG